KGRRAAQVRRLARRIVIARKGRYPSGDPTWGRTDMNISTIFLRTGVLALIAGIGIGMAMGITGHFEFRHAHAHTNLVGWASMRIYGFFYRLFPDAAAGLLPRIHAALAIPALVLMIVGALLIAQGDLAY